MAPNETSINFHTPSGDSGESTLRGLSGIRPLYFLPADPLAGEVLIPGFQVSDNVDCMVGFFSSTVLKELAPGLARYIQNTNNSVRLIISPYISDRDRDAIERGTKSLQDAVEEIIEQLVVTEDLLERHALHCLSYLLQTGRIELKIAVMKNALFHPKVWIFKQENDVMAVHGSSNLTFSGVRKNFEQIAVEFSWKTQGNVTLSKSLKRNLTNFGKTQTMIAL